MAADSPYPGLRSFEQSESHLFFGRERALSDMIEKLRHRRFLAVTGPSGCGKSSLIKAGLLEELDSGFLSAESPWRTIIFRPGNRPLGAMANALTEAFGATQERPELLEARLWNDEDALAGWLNFISAPRETLFIVVDQFEEVFRFEDTEPSEDRVRRSQREEVEEFVDVLLRATRSETRQIFVIITMRIDFLGDCATVPGLIEAINDSHFLTPRMTRLQCAEAIREPARVFEGEVDDALVTEMLNDLSLADGDTGSAEWTNPDLLPLLQNVLARMWRQAKGKQGVRLTKTHYDNVGRLGGALNTALDSIYGELSASDQKVAERLFKLLVQPESTHRQRDVRRPSSVADLVEGANADIASVKRVIDAFRAEGRNFLMPPPNVPLASGQIVDISHESLIRQWERLQGWVRDEHRSADLYRQLENHAENAASQTDLLNDKQIAVFEPWWEETQPTSTWAARYGADHEEAFAFYRRSIAKRDERRDQERRALEQEILKKRRWQTLWRQFWPFIAGGAVATTILLGVIAYNIDQQNKVSQSIAAADRATQLVLDGLPLDALETIRGVLPRSLGGEKYFWPYVPRAEAALYLTLDALRSKWVLPGHRGAINGVDVAEDARLMATASADGFARLWNLRTSERIGAWVHPSPAEVVDVAVSQIPIRDSRHWLVSVDSVGVARVWAVSNPTPLAVMNSSWARVATFSADGARIYVLRDDGAVDVYRTEDIGVEGRSPAPSATLTFRQLGARLQIGDTSSRAWRVAAAPDVRSDGRPSEMLLVSARTGTIAMRVLTDEIGMVPGSELSLRGGAGPADISPDGNSAAIVDQDGVQLWDLRNETGRYISSQTQVSALAFTPDSSRVLIASDRGLHSVALQGGESNAIGTPANIANLRSLAATAAGPSGSPLGWNVVIGEESGAVGVYSPEETSQVVASFADREITATALSQDGAFAAIAVTNSSEGDAIQVINTQTGEVVRRLRGHAGGWRISQFSRDGRRVFSVAPDNTVVVSRADTGNRITSFAVSGTVLGIAEGAANDLLVAFKPRDMEAPEVRLAQFTIGGSLPVAEAIFEGDFRGLWTSPSGEYFLVAVDALHVSAFGSSQGVRRFPNGQFQISEPLLTNPFSGNGRWGLALSAGSARTPVAVDLPRGEPVAIPGGAALTLFASPNDQYIAVANLAQVRVFEPDRTSQSLTQVFERQLGEEQIDGQFASDSRRFVTVGQRGSFTMFNLARGTAEPERAAITERLLTQDFLFTDSLSHGAFIDNQRLQVFERQRGRLVTEIDGVCQGTVTNFRRTSRLEAIVVYCRDSDPRVLQTWDLRSRTLIATTPWASETPGSGAIATNGDMLVGSTALVMRREGNTLTPRFDLPLDAPRNGVVTQLALSANGDTVASYGSDQYLRVWNDAGVEVDAISVGATQIRHFGFAGDRIVMATGDGAIRVWTIANGRLAEIGRARHSNLHVASIANDGSSIATGSTTGEVCVWQLTDLRSPTAENQSECESPVALANRQPVQVIGFSANGDVVAVGQTGGMIRVPAGGGTSRSSQAGAEDNVVMGGAVNGSTGRVLLARLDGSVLATPDTGQETSLLSPVARLPDPRFVAGGRMVLAPMADGTVHLLETDGGGLVAVLGRRGPTPIVVHEASGENVILVYGNEVLIERVTGIPLNGQVGQRFLVGSSLAEELSRYLNSGAR